MRVYFLGICGTAMGNTACLLKRQGHQVEGSDAGVYPPMSDILSHAGIPVYDGFNVDRLAALEPRPDLVVVGNAISRGNPEVEWLLDSRAIPFTSLPRLIRDTLLTHNTRSIVVAGTHGKTTTCAIAAALLRANDADPGWLIGGVPKDLPSGAHISESLLSHTSDSALPAAAPAPVPFVIEGDEYDSAFFDKRSKFIHYHPHVACLNNLEFDHGDIFRDLVDIQRSFSHFLKLVPRSGVVVANGDDANLAPLLDVPWTRVVRVGEGEFNELRITDFTEHDNGSSFELAWRNQSRRRIEWPLNGLFNARNAAVAILCAAYAMYRPESRQAAGAVPSAAATPGISSADAFPGSEPPPFDPLSIDLSALADFRGVKRRQQLLWKDENLTVFEDFAHHPTAVAGIIESLSRRFPGYHLTTCFEPRSNTTCTAVFQSAYEQAFKAADSALFGPVYRAERYADNNRLDTARLAQAHADGFHFEQFEPLLDALQKQFAPSVNRRKQILCFFSNGAFGGIIPKFVKFLENRQ